MRSPGDNSKPRNVSKKEIVGWQHDAGGSARWRVGSDEDRENVSSGKTSPASQA